VHGFMTVKEAAKKWNVSERQVQLYCQKGILAGVSRIGRSWIIPEDAVKPVYMFTSPMQTISKTCDTSLQNAKNLK